jgi:hypothetical protein
MPEITNDTTKRQKFLCRKTANDVKNLMNELHPYKYNNGRAWIVSKRDALGYVAVMALNDDGHLVYVAG